MYADPCGSGSGSTALAQDNPESLFSLACSVRYSKLAQVGPASILSMMHIQNVPRQNVTRQNVPRHKVPGTKCPRDKNVPRDKTSQGQNVPETSQGKKRPKGTNEAIISYVWPIT